MLYNYLKYMLQATMGSSWSLKSNISENVEIWVLTNELARGIIYTHIIHYMIITVRVLLLNVDNVEINYN